MAFFKWKRSWFSMSVNWPAVILLFTIFFARSLPLVGGIRRMFG